MKTLGLDIGTTTISAAVVEDGVVLSAVTLKNDSFLLTDNAWERIQNPDYIRQTALQAVEQLLLKHPDASRIGVTGQMHGIVYLDVSGAPVSPLYTWQDGRGDLPYDGATTYAQYLSKLTGHSLSTGFGMVTHFYNLKNGLVPENATVFCTIHDYLTMVLTGKTSPVTDASDAASFGLFCVEKGCYDEAALQLSGIGTAMLPPVASTPYIGCYQGRIPVFAAIGDNQASFLGATGGKTDCMLVNVGTGGQFSVYTDSYMQCPGLETRPFPGGGYLIVGASLCSGRAYAMLECFLRDVLQQLGNVQIDSCYDAMDKLLAQQDKPDDLPCTVPQFQGTREYPTLRGSITGLAPENLTVRHLIWSFLDGITNELHDMYIQYCAMGGKGGKLIGSGNGLRKNSHLQACFAEAFGQDLIMSACTEEAATGAALYAATATLFM